MKPQFVPPPTLSMAHHLLESADALPTNTDAAINRQLVRIKNFIGILDLCLSRLKSEVSQKLQHFTPLASTLTIIVPLTVTIDNKPSGPGWTPLTAHWTV